MKEFDKKIVLEDGEEYFGYGFGANVESINEIVFNTSVVGYQEICSDPSYTYQMVVMTYPLIGNYGITDDDYETNKPTIGGLIVREYNDIRDKGSRKVIITDISTSKEEALEKMRNYEIPKDAVSKVSCKKRWYSRTANPKFNVVAVDCGIKLNIVRSLNKRGCNVTIVPYNTSFTTIQSLKPDGIFLSNGPGDPENVVEVIDLVKKAKGKYPIFGICLGHQMISLAYGATTYKLKFGHRGGNHPVKNLETGKIEITSQNHSYAVNNESINNTPLKITHINVLDNTIEGVECKEDKVFSVQYHPESAPGPQDSSYLFDKFIEMMK